MVADFDIARGGTRRISPPIQFPAIFILNIQEIAMASTSLSLGPHWEAFIRQEVESGRFGTASEVVRAALRELEDRNKRLEALQRHVGEGLAEADRGNFADDYDIEAIIQQSRTDP
jgi:antitoxin ParD1/3/4